MKDSQNFFFMKLAIEEAKKNLKDGSKPFGVVITQSGRKIAQKFNQSDKFQDPTAHAEIEAIREATQTLKRKYLADCILYTTCEPCVMCLGAILWAKIPRLIVGITREKVPPKLRKIIYADSHPWVDKHSLKDYPVLVKEGVLEKECLRLFEEYAKRK